jgi:Protein of unknown function (DUF3606)
VTDDPAKTRPQDALRVNVGQEHELCYWTEKFGVTAEQLREAVQQVGPMAEDVADFLGAEARSR